MNLIAWPSFTLFPLHLALALFLVRSQRSNGRMLFALVNLLLSVWSLAHGLYVLAPNRLAAVWCYRMATIAWVPLPAVIFHVLTELTQAWSKPSHRRTLLVLLYAPVLALLLRFGLSGRLLDRDIEQGPYGWYELSDLSDPWAAACVVESLGAALAGLLLVHRWQLYSNRRLQKLQGRIIVWTGCCALLASLTYAMVLPTLVPGCPISTMSPLPVGIWILGMWHAMSRYGLLHVSPALAAENILQAICDPLVIADEDQCIERVNLALERLLGVGAESLLRRPIGYALSGSSLEPNEWKRRLEQGDLGNTEVTFQDQSGQTHVLMVSATKVHDSRNQSSGYVLVMRDVTALKEAQMRLQHMATHDPLTELPNRVLFRDRAEQAFARARRSKTEGALLLLDLDGFKQINDTHGHEAGDEVLRQVAARCKKTLRETDTVARLGGDEFVALLTDLDRSQSAKTAILRLERALSQPVSFGDNSIPVKVSIGMSAFPRDGFDLETLMRIADAAMYTAKEASKITESATIRLAARLALDPRLLAANLPLALDRKQFELYFQPLHNVSNATIVGIEALLRWQHPEYGMIGPLQFLPLAERSDLIVSIGAWVLRMACIQNKTWQLEGIAPVPIAVNVTAKQLVRNDFAETVRNILDECELSPSHLQLEISELSAMHDLAAIRKSLVNLQSQGVGIIVDDFGSGHAALKQLSKLPVHAIKINQHLVRNMALDERDATIVRAIISMAGAFGIRAIAKGIETDEQLAFLRRLHDNPPFPPKCDLVQGFVFSHPMPAHELRSALLAGARSASADERAQ